MTDKSAFGSVPAGKIKLPKRIPKSTLILPCPKSKYSQLKRILKNKTNKKRIFLALFSLRLELSEYRRLYSFTTLTDKSGFIRCALRAFFTAIPETLVLMNLCRDARMRQITSLPNQEKKSSKSTGQVHADSLTLPPKQLIPKMLQQNKDRSGGRT